MRSDYQACSRCGRVFKKGQVRYLVTINLVADFDGTLEPQVPAGGLESIWKEIEGRTEEDLINEVHQKMSYVLCKNCRDLWVASPLGGEELGNMLPAGRVH